MWNIAISFGLLICLIFVTIRTEADSKACEQREKNLAILDLAKESISKAKVIHPNCVNDDEDISTNSSKCGVKEKVSAFLDIAMNLIEQAKKNYSSCDVITRNLTEVIELHKKPADCSEILENGQNESGVYTIWPRHRILKGRPLEVYCDMDTDGGGWMVIQRRGNFSHKVDFYRNWNDYKKGFGNITEEFWIGNEIIFALTNQGDYAARFDIERVGREYLFAEYSSFWIEDENTKYMLHFGNYSGTAGDGIPTLRNMKFSTKDQRNDIWTSPCTTLKQGGWWYSGCGGSNPNGVNQPGSKGAKYITWDNGQKDQTTRYDALQAIEIKIRAEN